MRIDQIMIIVIVLFSTLIFSKMIAEHRYGKKTHVSQEEKNWKWGSWTDKTEKKEKIKDIPIEPKKEDPVLEQIKVSTYEEAIKASKEKDMPVLVVFEADWCGACKELKSKTLQSSEVKQSLKNFILLHVDADKNRKLTNKMGITALPTCVVIDKNEKKLGSKIGYMKSSTMINWLKIFK